MPRRDVSLPDAFSLLLGKGWFWFGWVGSYDYDFSSNPLGKPFVSLLLHLRFWLRADPDQWPPEANLLVAAYYGDIRHLKGTCVNPNPHYRTLPV
ncbi:hypothetical protein BAE44_0004640 [Dichanthelium oligosanthes]|uniref:Uncharacterized protein n=1 Tax=Dichanthelium oligosanthes TaxID=888268 RepID=A0A1E5WAA7_9POAL|nr:hypothetical protein BAE44_0004640 [Dichanthelium oligosanthes]